MQQRHSCVVSPTLLLLLLMLTSHALQQAEGAGHCPCAFLERGGFWSSPLAAKLGVSNSTYWEPRCHCRRQGDCERRWRLWRKSLTVQWIGSYGARSSQIQLQFCSSVLGPGVRPCPVGRTSFTLQQVGWWLDLRRVSCRCPGAQLPSIHRFRYARPAAANESFNGRLVDFVCEQKPVCSRRQACYRELLVDGRLPGGTVTCSCPRGSFCPIYHLGAQLRTPFPSEDAALGYQLTCQPEPPA